MRQVPPRPAGQRTEPENNSGFPGFGFGEGFHMSFGIGAFPFGVFTSSFNFGDPRPSAGELHLPLILQCFSWWRNYFFPCTRPSDPMVIEPSRVALPVAPRGTAQHEEEQFLSKIFLWVAILFVLWLVFAWRDPSPDHPAPPPARCLTQFEYQAAFGANISRFDIQALIYYLLNRKEPVHLTPVWGTFRSNYTLSVLRLRRAPTEGSESGTSDLRYQWHESNAAGVVVRETAASICLFIFKLVVHVS